MEEDVIDTVTGVKGYVATLETIIPEAVMAGLVPAIHVFGCSARDWVCLSALFKEPGAKSSDGLPATERESVEGPPE